MARGFNWARIAKQDQMRRNGTLVIETMADRILKKDRKRNKNKRKRLSSKKKLSLEKANHKIRLERWRQNQNSQTPVVFEWDPPRS